jgi:hypothetical protein
MVDMMSRSNETGLEQKRNKYADISVIFSFASLFMFYVYGHLHTRLLHLKISRVVYPEQAPVEEIWLSWPLVTSLNLASLSLAAAALALSLASLKKKPRRLYALFFALFAFFISFFILL